MRKSSTGLASFLYRPRYPILLPPAAAATSTASLLCDVGGSARRRRTLLLVVFSGLERRDPQDPAVLAFDRRQRGTFKQDL